MRINIDTEKFESVEELQSFLEGLKPYLSETQQKEHIKTVKTELTRHKQKKGGYSSRQWSEKADNLVRKALENGIPHGKERKELRRKLHELEGFIRTKHAVTVRISFLRHNKAVKVQKVKKVNGRRTHKWTDAEKNILRKNANKPVSAFKHLLPGLTSKKITAMKYVVTKKRKAEAKPLITFDSVPKEFQTVVHNAFQNLGHTNTPITESKDAYFFGLKGADWGKFANEALIKTSQIKAAYGYDIAIVNGSIIKK